MFKLRTNVNHKYSVLLTVVITDVYFTFTRVNLLL